MGEPLISRLDHLGEAAMRGGGTTQGERATSKLEEYIGGIEWSMLQHGAKRIVVMQMRWCDDRKRYV